MLTRCPKCKTLFPLGKDDLTQAQGRVRCCQCRAVFYALENLHQADGSAADPTTPPELRQSLRLGPDTLPASPTTQSCPSAELPAILRNRETNPSGWFWSTLALLLALTALAQWAWLERDGLVEQPRLRPWLEQACERLDCRLPAQRDLAQLEVLDRHLRASREDPGVLLFELSLVNRATFSQPYPMLELELFDKTQRSLGRRLFSPIEYLHQTGADQLAPQQTLSMTLRLLDLEQQVAGFEFRFL